MNTKIRLESGGLFTLLLIALLVLLTVSMCICTSVGQADVPLSQTVNTILYKATGGSLGSIDGIANSTVSIIWQIRLPRVIQAVLVGMALAICGVVMQALVQNPLADPFILGISSGSSLGATFAILIGFGSSALMAQLGLAFGAFVGAAGASLSVLLLSSVGGRMTSLKLVLSGTVISALCGSFSNFIVYFANNAEGMKTVAFWSMGSLASASWDKLTLLFVTVLAVVLFFLFQHRILNAMLLEDEAAVTLGINLSRYRRGYMLLSSLLTGVVVAFSGMIGFVGLIIPHIVRGFIGSDHKRLLPVCALVGSLFLVWADVLSRTLIDSVELPIGIITALIGAPMFIYIIIKKGYNFGG